MLEETATDKCSSGMCVLEGSSGSLLHSTNELGLMNLRYAQSQTESSVASLSILFTTLWRI